MTKAYYIVAYKVFGANVWGYKLASLLLHSLVVALAFHLISSITRDLRVAALSTLFFAGNPIHAEAVVWTYSVSYLLVATFALSALLLLRSGRNLLAVMAYVAAMLTHEMGVLLLPILFLHRWLVEDARTWRDYMPLAPFVAALGLFLMLRNAFVGAVPLTSLGPIEFLNTAAVVATRYLKMVFWPDAPVTIYLYEVFSDPSLLVLVAYGVCAGLLGVAFALYRRDRIALFWLFWFGVWISISFNFGQMGEYMMAEKLAYLASIGVSVLVATFVVAIFEDRQKALLVIAFLVFGAQAFVTINRIENWLDTQTYLQASLDHAPRFHLSLYTLSATAIINKDYEKAELLLRRALDARPDYSPAYNNLANLTYMKGDWRQAVLYWEEAFRYDPTNPKPYFNMGMALQNLGYSEKAKSSFDRYLQYEANPPREMLETIRSFGY